MPLFFFGTDVRSTQGITDLCLIIRITATYQTMGVRAIILQMIETHMHVNMTRVLTYMTAGKVQDTDISALSNQNVSSFRKARLSLHGARNSSGIMPSKVSFISQNYIICR